ncbi:MAG: RadC family protein [Bacteroidales bacterium]
MKTRSIKTWDEEERPREKLMQQGAASLTNTELLAILLRSGTAEKSAIDLARDVMAISGGRLDALAREEAACLKAIHGIGAAKATAILACFELARRLAAEIPEDELTVRTSLVVARMMGPRLHDLPHEECWALFLNRANRLIGKERVSSGGLSSTVIDIKIIVKKAVDRLSSGIILVHNHPSGNPQPGGNDRTQTDALRRAAAVFDIVLIDHVIIGKKKYFSFSDEVESRW